MLKRIPLYRGRFWAGRVLYVVFWIGVIWLLGSVVFLYMLIREMQTGEAVLTNEKMVSSAQKALDPPYCWPMLDPNEPIDLVNPDEDEEISIRHQEIAPSGAAVIPYSGLPLNLRFRFTNYVSSYGRNWGATGSGPVLKVENAINDTFSGEPGKRGETWGDHVSENALDAQPYFDVSLPLDETLLARPLEDRAIRFVAKMDVVYPNYGGSDDSTLIRYFKTHRKELEHAGEIYLLTADEVAEYERLAAASEAEASKAAIGRLLPFSLGSLVLIGFAVVVGRRTGLKPKLKSFLVS